MTRPVVIDVIAKDDASATFRKIAAEQAALGKATDQTSKSFTQSSQNLRKSQLQLIAAQERYNKVATDGKASVGQLASAQSTLISAQQRVGKATGDAALAQRKLNNEFDDAKKKSADANRGMSALVTTGLALGPALIPVGVAAAGAVAAAGGAAVTAGLAFLGLRDAWKAGTLQATPLGKQIGVFRDEFEHLKTLSAGAVMPGFTKALHELTPLFAPLNRSVALFGTQIGQIAANVAPGFVRIFTQLQPLFQTFGNLLVQGSQKFAQWANSTDSVKQFVAYVQTNLPAVMSTITSLVTTAGHVVAGFAPFGSTSLLAIKLLSQAINAIPVGVLQVLVPLLTGAVLGMKAFKAADAAATSLGGLATKLGAAGTVAKGASGFVGTLGKAVGFLGPAGIVAGVGLGILSGIMGNHAKKAQEDAQRVNDLNQALQDGNLHFVLYTQLVKSGAIPAADQLGISQKTVLDAVTGVGGGMADLQAKIFIATGKYNELAAASQQSATINGDQAKSLQDLRGNLEKVSTEVQQAKKDYDDAKKAAADYAKAQGDAALSADILSGKAKDNAAALGLTEDAYINGKLAADKNTASLAAQHAQLVINKDAAGLLKDALDKLNGVQLTLEGTNIAFNSSLLTLTGSLATNGKTIALNTQKGLDNRRSVLDSINAAKDNAVAVEGGTRATAANTETYKDNIKQILDHVAKANGDKTATDRQKDSVYQLVLQLSGYNRLPVPTKKATVDGSQIPPAILKAQDDINSLHGKTVPVTIQWSGPGGAPGPAAAGFFGKATGGPISGPGTKTSDSVPIMASAGEFMMRADAVSKYGLGFMQNLNTMKYAQGGPIILQLPSGVAAHGEAIENALHPVWNIARPAVGGGVPGVSGPASASVAALQAYALSLFRYYNWDSSQMSSLISLWNGESGWNPAAYNASSGATGIPQSLPASKMASAGADYLTNGNTQIRWGENYISQVYGSPSAAYSAWLSRSPHWYGGGLGPTVFTHPTMIGVGERGPETVSITPGRYGGSGVVVAPGAITVYAAAGMDAKEVARQAFVELRRWVADEERRAAKGARA